MGGGEGGGIYVWKISSNRGARTVITREESHRVYIPFRRRNILTVGSINHKYLNEEASARNKRGKNKKNDPPVLNFLNVPRAYKLSSHRETSRRVENVDSERREGRGRSNLVRNANTLAFFFFFF